MANANAQASSSEFGVELCDSRGQFELAQTMMTYLWDLMSIIYHGCYKGEVSARRFYDEYSTRALFLVLFAQEAYVAQVLKEEPYASSFERVHSLEWEELSDAFDGYEG